MLARCCSQPHAAGTCREPPEDTQVVTPAPKNTLSQEQGKRWEALGLAQGQPRTLLPPGGCTCPGEARRNRRLAGTGEKIREAAAPRNISSLFRHTPSTHALHCSDRCLGEGQAP